MADTLAYYSSSAVAYFESTVALDMSELYGQFLEKIPARGLILDLGCGSGRDTKHFLSLGFRVHSIDACRELAALAEVHTNQPIDVADFREVEYEAKYDGIWACGSLLHVAADELPTLLGQLWRAIKPGGVFYLSFQCGPGEGVSERSYQGRHYTDVDEPAIRNWLQSLPAVDRINTWQTRDVRPECSIIWTNVLAARQVLPVDKLVPGGANPFLPHLCSAIARAKEIDVAVSFTKITGLRLLVPDLELALQRHDPARIRILTSDYLDVTDPEALRLLMLLVQQGAQVKIFHSAGTGFHLKAWLFIDAADKGHAFIGSSNITRQALEDGIEWNYRIDYPPDPGFLEARNRFEELFVHPKSLPLSHDWIHSYELRRVKTQLPIAPGSTEREFPPMPTEVQIQALAALHETRKEGFSRGLVVMATGLGKTWLAAFDASAANARRILFVAHREEILYQAAETFLRIRSNASVGFYKGEQRDTEADVLCASIQTIAKPDHLRQFAPSHFDYIVVDEFHHAVASSYRKLLAHFSPRFLLGLTATPDRTDQSNILSLCDDNLVFTCNLFEGVSRQLLSPFHYYGIYDDAIDYKEIPWRSIRTDLDRLESKLATLARARHAHQQWQLYKQQRTLAFCISIKHADFMADQFKRLGIAAAAVHGHSQLSRSEALTQLRNKEIEVLFSVDLFNEGVDLPEIDTVMLLRPTDSTVLFLQQVGRGLRVHPGKERLVILDFIGNDKAFLNRPQLFATPSDERMNLSDFAKHLRQQTLPLPDGCFINYDLRLLDFMTSLDTRGLEKLYESLKATLDCRPTRLEFHRAGAAALKLRADYNGWYGFLKSQGDLEITLDTQAVDFLAELETTKMTRSYKMILLEAFQELGGWQTPPTVQALADRSWEVIHRRPMLLAEIPKGVSVRWQSYWYENPINAWIGGNSESIRPFFQLDGDTLRPSFHLPEEQVEFYRDLVQELIDFRLAVYQSHLIEEPSPSDEFAKVTAIDSVRSNRPQIPYYPNIPIACGHFKTGTDDDVEHRILDDSHGRLNPATHFIARASGNSMNGGRNPIQDGDYLLLERISPNRAGSIAGSVLVVERQDASGDNQYLLRQVIKTPEGERILRANNPDYKDIQTTEEFRTHARLKAILEPWELAVGQKIKREQIPELFGEVFNIGSWNLGHIALNKKKAHILLITLNKQGKAEDHRYHDHWVDDSTFHWQSQNQTTPGDKKGREIINHRQLGIKIHLFIREEKLHAGKSAPFTYYGPVDYVSHKGSQPMSVLLRSSR